MVSTFSAVPTQQLPILSALPEIIACEASYIIVVAETGSGKSTELPLALLRQGLRVLVTEPLIETVLGTSEYTASLHRTPFGTTIGYRTAKERKDSPNTRLLYCTDGLALVREMAGHNQFDVLVIDEIHQWNLNQETLEAWAWLHLNQGNLPFKKVIVLSATLDAEQLSVARNNAPIFKVEGRGYSIKEGEPGPSMFADILSLIKEDYDILAFLPGWREIRDEQDSLTRAGLDVEIIPFHGAQLDRDDKDRAYAMYYRPKVILSTPALETGRTICPSPGRKLAVIDSGMERRKEVRNGIEELVLAPIARSTALQRKGRTGRVGPGVYVNRSPQQNQPDYPTPEIQRSLLDQTVLRLAAAGYDARELPFFHPVDPEAVKLAFKTLRALGAMDDNDNLTETGRRMAQFPVGVRSARMLIEADRLGVSREVTRIVSIIESGDFRKRDDPRWYPHCSNHSSDLIALLEIFNKLSEMGIQGKNLGNYGIIPKVYYAAVETFKHLIETLKDKVTLNEEEPLSQEQAEHVIYACLTGLVDNIYTNDDGRYDNQTGIKRQLDRNSVVGGRSQIIAGLPLNLEVNGSYGKTMLYLVRLASTISIDNLKALVPNDLEILTRQDPYYSPSMDMVYSDTIYTFRGKVIKRESNPDPDHPEADNLRRQFEVTPEVTSSPRFEDHYPYVQDGCTELINELRALNNERKPAGFKLEKSIRGRIQDLLARHIPWYDQAGAIKESGELIKAIKAEMERSLQVENAQERERCLQEFGNELFKALQENPEAETLLTLLQEAMTDGGTTWNDLLTDWVSTINQDNPLRQVSAEEAHKVLEYATQALKTAQRKAWIAEHF